MITIHGMTQQKAWTGATQKRGESIDALAVESKHHYKLRDPTMGAEVKDHMVVKNLVFHSNSGEKMLWILERQTRS